MTGDVTGKDAVGVEARLLAEKILAAFAECEAISGSFDDWEGYVRPEDVDRLCRLVIEGRS